MVNGAKTWISNARRSGLIALLCKTDPDARPRHKGVSILLVEHGPGLTVSKDLPKLGYKGVESCELVFEDYRAPAGAVLGGVEGHGFAQMMKGLETGRIQVASRALGVARAAFDDALGLRAAAGGVRRFDLEAPVDRQLPGRHGNQGDRGPAADPARGRAVRFRPALRHGGRHGQAVRLGDRDAGRAGRGAHPRRLRLFHRVRRRTLLPRRPPDDRRARAPTRSSAT